MKTVYYKGSGLRVQEEVFQHYGLTNHQTVSEEMFWNIIEMNAQIGIAMCNVKIELSNEPEH